MTIVIIMLSDQLRFQLMLSYMELYTYIFSLLHVGMCLYYIYIMQYFYCERMDELQSPIALLI